MVDDNDSDPLGMLDAAMEAELAQPDIIPEPGSGGDRERPQNVAVVLAHIAQQHFTLLVDQEGTVFADYMDGRVRKTVPLQSEAFDNVMRRRYAAVTNGGIARADSLRAAREYLVAVAEHEAPRIRSAMRRADKGGKIYIDLCDDLWRVVEIDKDGWRIGAAPEGIRFKRSSAMNPLPLPVAGGTLADFRAVINVKDEDGLIVVILWLLAALTRGPYPILNISGPDGSGKSTNTEFIGDIIDPSKYPRKVKPKKDEDYIINCLNQYVQRYDNLSRINMDEMDIICGISTGSALSTRKFFTNGEIVQFSALAPFILNGIPNLAERRDLASRTLPLLLEPPSDDMRATERECRSLFAELHPKLLGFICQVAHRGLANLPHVKLEKLPRMADNAEWFYACADAFIPGGSERLTGLLSELDNELAAANIAGDTFARIIVTALLEAEGKAKPRSAVDGSTLGVVVDSGEDAEPRYNWRVQAKELHSTIARIERELRESGEVIKLGSVPASPHRIRDYMNRSLTALAKGGVGVGRTTTKGASVFSFSWTVADRFEIAYNF